MLRPPLGLSCLGKAKEKKHRGLPGGHFGVNPPRFSILRLDALQGVVGVRRSALESFAWAATSARRTIRGFCAGGPCRSDVYA